MIVGTDVAGSITKVPDQTSYTPNSTVTLSATAKAGYEFIGWTDADQSTFTQNPLVLTVNANQTITPNFGTVFGTVNFRNRESGIFDAPIFDSDGTTKLEGPRYLAQLYGGPTAGNLQPSPGISGAVVNEMLIYPGWQPCLGQE